MIKKGFKATAVGVMSGTSLDGLDLCYSEFEFNTEWNFKILNSTCIEYSEEWKSKLAEAHKLKPQELDLLDAEFGKYIASETLQFLSKSNLSKPNWICSHGHTVFHNPSIGITKQIGSGKTIASVTGVSCISDFRSLDVQLDGQGAPLVPIGDKLLFSNYDACLNLGGFANISFDENSVRKAFDICPVNIVLNRLANEIGLHYDIDGKIADSSTIQDDLKQALHKAMPCTKHSLAREWLSEFFLPIIDSSSYSVEDKLATVTSCAAEQIAEAINQSTPNGNVLITGGGAYNTKLINSITELTKASITIPDKEIIDNKEALVFAFLGVLRSENNINVLSSVTGSSRDSSSGTIHHP